jgi:hypothetical protein
MAADIALSAADEFFIYKKHIVTLCCKRAGEPLITDERGG